MKDIIFNHGFDKIIVGFINDKQGDKQVVKIYHSLTICDKNSGANVIGCNYNLFLLKKDFIAACKRWNLTFIDPDPETCEYLRDEDDEFDNDWWCSKCNLIWTLNDGTPKDNGMEYCPKCGRKIIYKEGK